MMIRRIIALLALCAPLMGFVADRAMAEDDAALVAPVQHLVDAINQGNSQPPTGVFTEDCVVLDDFAPYRWSGKGNATAWYKDLMGQTKAAHDEFLAMKAKLSVEAPRFSRVTADTAYFVLPGLFLFNTDPKTRIRQTSQWVISEKRVHGHWLIAGHAWGITSETPVAAQ